MISRFPMGKKNIYYPTERINLLVGYDPFDWSIRVVPQNDDYIKFVVRYPTNTVKFTVGGIGGIGGLDWFEGVRIYTLIFKNQIGGVITSRDIHYGVDDREFNLSLPEISFISAENVRQPIGAAYSNVLTVSQ